MAAGNPSLTSAYVTVWRRSRLPAGWRIMAGPLVVQTAGRPGAARMREPPSSLADHQPLQVMGAVVVVPAGRAVARRRARHRVDLEGEPGWVAVAVPTGIGSVTRREMSSCRCARLKPAQNNAGPLPPARC